MTQRQEGGADQAEYLVSSGRVGQISGYDEGRKAERGRVDPRWRGPPSRRLEDVRAVEQERGEVVPMQPEEKMEVALGAANWLLGQVLNKLSDVR